MAQDLSISHESGYHGTSFTLKLECTSCDAIYYSVDGTDPLKNNKYKAPILVSQELVAANKLAYVPTTVVPNVGDNETWHSWQPPGNYEKAVSIRVSATENGERIKEDHFRTYFFDEKWNEFPTISISIEPKYLIDDSIGIMVPGIHVDPQNSIWTGNYQQSGKEWEHPLHYSYFEADKEFVEKDLGVRIHGLKAAAAPQKSFRLYAKKKYGSGSIPYDFKSNPEKKHKRLLLRTPYSCHASKLISDIVIHELARPTHLDIMDYGIARTFINGEYWGIHLVRERVDEKYISERKNCKDKNVLIPGNYDQPEFSQMFQYLKDHDIAEKAVYRNFAQLLDLENFMDYVIFETYFRNTDWLINNNNVTFWKEKGFGKWRLVLIDMDAAFQQPEGDMFDFMKTYSESMVSTLFLELMKNAEFRHTLASRYNELLSSHLAPERCFHIIDSISELIRPELSNHIDRWGHPTSVFAWNKELDAMRSFINKRNTVIDDEWSRHFKFESTGIKEGNTIFFISQDEKLIGGISFTLLLMAVWLFLRKKKRRQKKSG